MKRDYNVLLNNEIRDFRSFGDNVHEAEDYIFTQKRWITIDLKKKRNRKKFLKDKRKYINRKTRMRFLGWVMSMPIRRQLDYPGIVSRILTVTPITTYEFDNET